MNLFFLCFRHIPEALNDFRPDIIAYNAGKVLSCMALGLTRIIWNRNNNVKHEDALKHETWNCTLNMISSTYM